MLKHFIDRILNEDFEKKLSLTLLISKYCIEKYIS